ncbi:MULTISPECIES: NB-ARC domain-containing protein [Pseudofrankia]|uniref:NB-ARC domain-containing protein n=1 Tax=Pseudofrankia TaxID=2994363 RepID=UPI000234D303|nr:MULTISPECIES: effector-associated domain EAD1-containing protein [Pseudofrankia]OHV33893.1 hypothetical protein BCD49_25580 [Pseudofrankia sp. EUN1h]
MNDGLTAVELATAFPDRAAALPVLRLAGFPDVHIPFDAATPLQFWDAVCQALRAGVMKEGQARLFAAARALYPHNPAFTGNGTASDVAPGPPGVGPAPDPPWQLPPPPALVVARPELEVELLAALLGPAGPVAGRTTGIEGEGGFGKTTLAAAVCARDEVRQAFPGGLLWVEVGEERHGAALAALLDDLAISLVGAPAGSSDPARAAARVAALLEARPPVLLVVDDVWRASQLAPFLAVGRACGLLVITRIRRVLPVGARSLLVDQMADDEARELLCGPVDGLPEPLVADLLAWTGGWPLLLGLAGSQLALAVRERAGLEQAAAWLLRQLVNDGPATLDVADERDRQFSVRATINASLSQLPEASQRHYLDLGIFPEDTYVPIEVVALLWGRAGDPDGREARRLCDRLVDLSLLRRRWSDDGPRFGLHDVLRAHLRSELGTAGQKAAHAALVAAFRVLVTGADGRGRWWLLPDGPVGDYLTRRLMHHLRAAGLVDEAGALACDPRWIEASIQRTGSSLAVEADLASTGGERAPLFGRVLAGSAHLLTGAPLPGGLGPTLAARLATIPALAAIAESYAESFAHPYLGVVWSTEATSQAQRRVLAGHTDAVTAVAFASDGRLLATGSRDGTARLWNTDSGTESAVLTGHPVWVRDVRFSPDGRLLATLGDDATLRLWKIDRPFESAVLVRHLSSVAAVAFSPDGGLFATAEDGRVRVWEAASGVERAVLVGHVGWVVSVEFSPDGRLLVAGGEDGSVRVWETDSGVERAALTFRGGQARGVMFSPEDGRLLAAADSHGTVWLWDITSGAVRAVPDDSRVQAAEFSPDGRVLATAGGLLEGSVRLWDTAGDAELAGLAGHSRSVRAVVFSRDGRLLATGGDDGTARLWETDRGAELAVLTGHLGAVADVAFSPDGQLLATVSDDRTARLWDVSGDIGRATVPAGLGEVRDVVFRPDGELLVIVSPDATVRLWEARSGIERAAFASHSGGWAAVMASSPSGDLLAIGAEDGTVTLRETADGTERAALNGHTALVISTVFSSDGALLVTAADDNTVRIWETADGAERVVLAFASGPVQVLALSPDGTLLATRQYGGPARLWDTTSGAERAVLGSPDNTGQAVVFSPDGRLVAASGDEDGTVRMWETASCTELAVLVGHAGWVQEVAFSPDSLLVATFGDDDGTARLSETATGVEIAMLTCRLGGVENVVFSPDSRLLATVSDEGIIQLWDTASGVEHAAWAAGRYAAMTFSPDGGLLASTGPEDGTVRLRDVATGTEVTALRVGMNVSGIRWRDDCLCCTTTLGAVLLRCHR